MQSQTIPLPTDLRWRRMVVVALFAGLIYFFRHLAPVFVCFIVLERSLGWLADQIDQRTPLHRKSAIAVVLTGLALAIGGLVFLGVRRSLPLVKQLRTHGSGYLASIFDHPLVEKLRHAAGLEGEGLSELLKGHAGKALHYATGTAHLLIFVLVGALLALIYLFEREEIDGWLDGLTPGSIQRTLARWFGYVGDAIAITVRMQVVVAAVNALVTLPILLVLGLPHIPMLFLLILVTGLLPVVGNVIAGVVLCYVAFTSKGAWAVGVFLASTFVLHKIESYYLNPRLASEHVKLPGLVLVISLLLFEQTFGFAGLFLSFPALYVASRIAWEWREELEALVTDDDGPQPEPEPA
jgi:predicted PurR-regulated permease PerM